MNKVTIKLSFYYFAVTVAELLLLFFTMPLDINWPLYSHNITINSKNQVKKLNFYNFSKILVL